MKKILKWVLIILLVFVVLITGLTIFSVKKYGPEIDKQNKEKEKLIFEKQKLKLDTIINDIKNDKEIKVTKVDYTTDSSLKIYLSPEKSEITAAGFDNLHQIMDVGIVSEIEVYKNNIIETSFGNRTQAKVNNFKEKYLSSWDGSCKPVVQYLKEKMNDPESFEHDRTFVTPLSNGNFEIKTVFRGKNAFGGKVLNTCIAEVNSKGEIINFNLEK